MTACGCPPDECHDAGADGCYFGRAPEPVTGHDSHQHRDTSGLVITLCTTCNRAFVNENAHKAWVKEQT